MDKPTYIDINGATKTEISKCLIVVTKGGKFFTTPGRMEYTIILGDDHMWQRPTRFERLLIRLRLIGSFEYKIVKVGN